MAMVIKAIVMKVMATNAFNVPDKDDGDDDNDSDEGEENGDGDGDGDSEEDRSTATLKLAWRRWSIRPASRDRNGDKVNGDKGDGDEGDGDGDENAGGGDGATEQVTLVNRLLVLNDYAVQLPLLRGGLRWGRVPRWTDKIITGNQVSLIPHLNPI